MAELGRKPKPIDLKLIEDLARQGLTEENIARMCGFNPQYWCAKKNEIPEISEALQKGRACDEQFLIQKLDALADKGNLGAIIFKLKAKHNWRDQDKAQINQAINLTANRVMTRSETVKAIQEAQALIESGVIVDETD